MVDSGLGGLNTIPFSTFPAAAQRLQSRLSSDVERSLLIKPFRTWHVQLIEEALELLPLGDEVLERLHKQLTSLLLRALELLLVPESSLSYLLVEIIKFLLELECKLNKIPEFLTILNDLCISVINSSDFVSEYHTEQLGPETVASMLLGHLLGRGHSLDGRRSFLW